MQAHFALLSLMSPQLSIFILAVIMVVGWFAAGTHLNVRKGHAAMRWLQDGLPLVGERTSLRWLGSSVVELKIQDAAPPFRQAEVLFVLEPRDVPVLWWYSRLLGRRDLFIFRANLRNRPPHEFELLDPRSWTARKVLPGLPRDEWSQIAAPAPLIAYASYQSIDISEPARAAVLDGSNPIRLSSRRREPNFEMQWRLADVRRQSSRTVFELIRRVTGVLS